MAENTKVEKLLSEVETQEFREEEFKAELFKNKDVLCIIAPTWFANIKKSAKDFATDFKKDYYRACADFGARPKAHIRRYWTIPEFIEKTAIRRQHPINGDGTFAPWFNGQGVSYMLGMDLSNLAHDNAAFCLAHEQDGKKYVDLFFVIPGGRGEHLIFSEIRNFIDQLRKRNFYIAKASLDSWQSLSFAQDLEKMGIQTEINSTDKNSEMPDVVQGMMLSGKVNWYWHPLFIKEAKELIRTKTGKVDHPANGSKDLFDAFVHAIYLLYKYPQINLSMGSL